MTAEGAQRSAFVLAGAVGERGGAARATFLLCSEVARLGLRTVLFSTSRPPDETISRLQNAGVKIITPVLDKGWRLRVPHRLIAIQSYLAARRERPLCILSVGLIPEARYLLMLPRVAPVYLWESTEALPGIQFQDPPIRRCLHRATKVLAPSRTIARNIARTHGYSGPIEILPFWVESPPSSSIRARSNEFLYVGRLDLDKGLEYLFEAFRRLASSRPAARLTVCGEGALAKMKALAEGCPEIAVRGFVSTEELETLIGRSAAVVLPSLHEGYPLSLLEACARGKPIIAAAVGSVPEVFGSRHCALLVPPKDVARLTLAMETIIAEEDETYYRRCQDASLLFREISSPDVVRTALLNVFLSNG